MPIEANNNSVLRFLKNNEFSAMNNLDYRQAIKSCKDKNSALKKELEQISISSLEYDEKRKKSIEYETIVKASKDKRLERDKFFKEAVVKFARVDHETNYHHLQRELSQSELKQKEELNLTEEEKLSLTKDIEGANIFEKSSKDEREYEKLKLFNYLQHNCPDVLPPELSNQDFSLPTPPAYEEIASTTASRDLSSLLAQPSTSNSSTVGQASRQDVQPCEEAKIDKKKSLDQVKEEVKFKFKSKSKSEHLPPGSSGRYKKLEER